MPARDRALSLLSRRDYSRAELATKLTSEGFSTSEVDDAMAHVVRYAGMDDQALAERLTQKLQNRGYGAAKVVAELAKRGLEAVVDDGEDVARARAAWADVCDKYQGRWQAAAGYLSRRGFSEETIQRVLPEQETAE